MEEHCSVEQSRRAQAEPISLDSCLKAFTGEEELGEDELYYCSKCRAHRLATKKLDLWRLPPVLVSGAQFSTAVGPALKPTRLLRFSDRPPEALPVRERSLDQIPKDCQIPQGEF